MDARLGGSARIASTISDAMALVLSGLALRGLVRWGSGDRFDVFNKVIWREMRASPVRLYLLRPHTMTILAIELALHEPELGHQANGKVGEQRFSGELGEINAQ
jgi:hypothetical protein